MTTQTPSDICNLDLIYNANYQYSLPRNLLESFLCGKAFDHPNAYSSEEAQKLKEDINDLYQQIMSNDPVRAPLAVISAGSPGSGKTVLLRQELERETQQGKTYAYICPDDVCLKNQKRTYCADLTGKETSVIEQQNAYTKWRPASNAATHILLGNLIREKFAFYFGSTSSSPQTGKFFEFLKAQGYRIKLVHLTASDKVRWESIQKRDQTFVQVTEDDVVKKGEMLPQRINDTFLRYADEIDFYYRGDVDQNAMLAAKWLRNKDSSGTLGTLEITENDAYEKVKSIHNQAVKALSRPDLYWEATVENCSSIL